ncbi:MAG: hypothetical protein MUO82_05175 [Candidatus Thermoplasmatota archaeon]|nr:hypothetical protein [Candidatus Thermoplasmatota archaeon]
MKKIVVFGCFLAVFLMLMIPVRPAVEVQNKNILTYTNKVSINYTDFNIIDWLLWLRDVFFSIIWHIFWEDFDWPH